MGVYYTIPIISPLYRDVPMELTLPETGRGEPGLERTPTSLLTQAALTPPQIQGIAPVPQGAGLLGNPGLQLSQGLAGTPGSPGPRQALMQPGGPTSQVQMPTGQMTPEMQLMMEHMTQQLNQQFQQRLEAQATKISQLEQLRMDGQ